MARAQLAGDVEVWLAATLQALRRSRQSERALILAHFSPPSSLLDSGQAERLMAVLAMQRPQGVDDGLAGASLRRMTRIWRGHKIDPPSRGEMAKWWMISGFESTRGAALARVDPPQNRFDPTETLSTPFGKRPWRQIRRARGKSLIFPQDWTYPTRARCSHFVAAFKTPKVAQISLRGGDEQRIWLDGQPLIEFAALESPLLHPVVIAKGVAPGRHQLEIRSCPRMGGGAFVVLVHDASGQTLEIESLAARPRLQPLSGRFERFDPDAEVSRLYAGVKDSTLRRLLSAARLATWGRLPDALSRLAAKQESSTAEKLLTLQLAQRSRRKELVMSAVETFGDSLPALAWRGQVLWSLNQKDRAARMVLPRSKEFTALGRHAQTLVGSLLDSHAPKGEAFRFWQHRHRQDPTWPLALQKLLQGYQQLGETRKARKLEKALKRLTPGAESLIESARDRALAKRKHKRAARHMQRLIRNDELDVGRRVSQAGLSVAAGRFEEARKMVEAILAQNPYSPSPLRWMAAQLGARHGSEAAAPYLERLAQVRPDHRQVMRAERFAALQRPNDEIKIPHWSRPSEEELATLVAERANYRPKRAVSQVLLLDDHLDLIQADGTRRQVITLVRWFLDRGTAQKYLKINLSGLRNRQIHQAYLMQPNGKRVDPVSMRGGKIRFREIGPESVLVLQYESTTRRSSLLNGLVEGTFWFEGTDLVSKRARFTLALARPDLEPQFTVLGPQPKALTGETKDLRVWSFERQDIGPALMERRVHAPWRYRSQVRFSTMKNWDPYVGWVRDLFRQSAKITPKLTALAASLTAKAKTAESKIDAVYRYAVEEIQYEQDYARVIEGWEPHLPDQVLDRRYGDCKDKTMLIITMLRSLGIEANPALIRTWRLGDIDRSLPGSQFNHAVVHLPKQTGIPTARFLDATAEYLDRDNLRIDIQGTDALVITDDAWSWINVPERPADDEFTRVELHHEGGRNWRAELLYRGHTAGMIRRAGEGEKQRFIMTSLATGLFWPGTEMLSGTVDEAQGRLRIRLQLKAPIEVLKPNGLVELPLLIKRVWISEFAQSERKLPLRLGSSRSLSLKLSSSSGALDLERAVKSEGSDHRTHWRCGQGKCHFESRIGPMVISPERYAPLGAKLRSFQAEVTGQELHLKPRI